MKNSIKPKILVLTTTFPRWPNDSTPPFVYHLCQNLSKNFEVIVLAPHCSRAKLKENMGNLLVYRYPYFFPFRLQKLCYEGGILPNIKASWLAKIQVSSLIVSEFISTYVIAKRERPKLIHAHWTIPQGIVALMIKKLFFIPVVVSAHAADVFTKNRVFDFLNSQVSKEADFITVTSLATKNAFPKLTRAAGTISVISMGVDVEKFKPVSKRTVQKLKKESGFGHEKIILFVGRLAEKKGVSYLIKAMPKILKFVKNSRLLIIGYGPEEEKLKKLSQELGLEGGINFLGKIPNEELPLYYNLSDILIAPSIEAQKGDAEGLPVVLLEAMASGKAVIGTKTGGITNLIENNKTGLLVKQKNSNQLAKATIKLLSDEKSRSSLGINARNYVEKNFEWEIISEKFRKIFEDIISAK